MNARTVFAALSILALAGCSEPSQELHSAAEIGQTPEYTGTGSQFVAPGWTQGDKASWTSEMTARTQRGQNEYTKTN
jgi:hypothetical protein